MTAKKSTRTSTRRRVLVVISACALALAAYAGWRVWQVQRDLAAAESSATRLVAAIDSGDSAAQKQALSELQRRASEARDGTDGTWWRGFTLLPVVGDDAEGLRALSRSLNHVAAGAQPIVDSLNGLERITQGGRIDLETVRSLESPIATAAASFDRARDEVAPLDSSGYAGVLRTRFDRYVDEVDDAADNLAVAERAVKVLPAMAGDDGPRFYLFIFQNNAEIRATGGLPGSWTLVKADGGAITIERQGAGSDFPVLKRGAGVPLTTEEQSIYGDAMGRFFLSANFTPDFERAAGIWRDHFERRFKSVRLDGVLSLDPVSLSYLLDGTGPIEVNGLKLKSSNVIEELLDKPYRTMTPVQQDRFFRDVAATILNSVTGDLQDPAQFVRAMSRAGREGRFLVAPFSEGVRRELGSARVLGRLAGGDTPGPQLQVAFNDATGSKMSYYLRYAVSAKSLSCDQDGAQVIEGTIRMSQSIRPLDARKLPTSVTGGGQYGTTAGEQTLFVQIIGPKAGTMSGLRTNGVLEADQSTYTLDGRPVYVLAIGLRSQTASSITWSVKTSPAQTKDGVVNVTPGIVPGNESSRFASSCHS